MVTTPSPHRRPGRPRAAPMLPGHRSRQPASSGSGRRGDRRFHDRSMMFSVIKVTATVDLVRRVWAGMGERALGNGCYAGPDRWFASRDDSTLAQHRASARRRGSKLDARRARSADTCRSGRMATASRSATLLDGSSGVALVRRAGRGTRPRVVAADPREPGPPADALRICSRQPSALRAGDEIMRPLTPKTHCSSSIIESVTGSGRSSDTFVMRMQDPLGPFGRPYADGQDLPAFGRKRRTRCVGYWDPTGSGTSGARHGRPARRRPGGARSSARDWPSPYRGLARMTDDAPQRSIACCLRSARELLDSPIASDGGLRWRADVPVPAATRDGVGA